MTSKEVLTVGLTSRTLTLFNANIDVEVKFKRVLLELKSSVNLRDSSTRSDVMTSRSAAQKRGAAKGLKEPKVSSTISDKSGNTVAGQDADSKLLKNESENKENSLLNTHSDKANEVAPAPSAAKAEVSKEDNIAATELLHKTLTRDH